MSNYLWKIKPSERIIKHYLKDILSYSFLNYTQTDSFFIEASKHFLEHTVVTERVARSQLFTELFKEKLNGLY